MPLYDNLTHFWCPSLDPTAYGSSTLHLKDRVGLNVPGGPHGTLVNVAPGDWIIETESQGIYGIWLKGNGQRIDLGNTADLSPANMTLGIWVKCAAAPAAYDGMIGRASTGAWSNGYGLWWQTATSARFYFGGYNVTFMEATGLTATDWNHFVVTWDGTTAYFYVNGVQRDSVAWAGPHSATDVALMVGRVDAAVSSNFDSNAVFDSILLFNAVLTAGQIAEWYAGGRTAMEETGSKTSTTSSTAAVTMTVTAPGALGDELLLLRGETGTANQGNLGGSGTYYGGMGTTTATPGVPVYTFDRTNDYIGDLGGVADYSFIQNTLNFSISLWIRLINLSTRDFLCGNTLASSEKGFLFGRDNLSGLEDVLRFTATNGSTSFMSVKSTAIINDTNWHHVVLTADGNPDGSGFKFYIDGVLDTTVVLTATGALSTGNSTRVLNVGRANYSSHAVATGGDLQDVRIFNRAITADEAAAIYSYGLPGYEIVNSQTATTSATGNAIVARGLPGQDSQTSTTSATNNVIVARGLTGARSTTATVSGADALAVDWVLDDVGSGTVTVSSTGALTVDWALAAPDSSTSTTSSSNVLGADLALGTSDSRVVTTADGSTLTLDVGLVDAGARVVTTSDAGALAADWGLSNLDSQTVITSSVDTLTVDSNLVGLDSRTATAASNDALTVDWGLTAVGSQTSTIASGDNLAGEWVLAGPDSQTSTTSSTGTVTLPGGLVLTYYYTLTS